VKAAMQAPTSPFSKPGKSVPSIFVAGLVCIFGLRKRMKHLGSWGLFAVCIAVTTLCLMTGCGGSSPSPDTAPGTYPLTLTATSGAVTKSVSLSLTVQ
jgi:hypothetical protein